MRPASPLLACLLALAVAAAAASPPARADDRVEPRLLEPGTGPDPSAPARKQHRVYFVQLGAYSTLREAAFLRRAVQNLGPVRVERVGNTYRVLLGRFGDAEAAEKFVADHRLRSLFPALWIDVLTTDISGGPGNGAAEIPLAEQEKETQTVNVDLYCGASAEGEGDGKPRRRGRYVAQFTQENGQPPANPAMEIRWSCATGNREADDWREKDKERNPSFVGVAPVTAMGSFSNTGGTLGDLGLTHFSYGLQLSAFKTLGGIGPLLEYRLINARYSGGSGNPTPIFNLQHSILVGARLPFAHRFEIEPMAGFVNQPFMTGSSIADATFKNVWTPQLGGRVRARVFELSNRASIDLTVGYGHYLSASGADAASEGGSLITGQLRARHFSSDTWGADWFFEFNSIARNGDGFSQSESLFRFGVTFLLETR